MLQEDALNIYTDGSSYSGPRAGGVGIIFVVVNDAGDAEIVNQFEYPGYRQANNQVMELEACIKGLDEALHDQNLQRYQKIVIFTDSTYVAEGIKQAMFVWPKTRWTNRVTGRPILHVDQWKRLLRLLQRAKRERRHVSIQWQRGKTNPYNKAADKAAKRSAKKALNLPLSVVSVRSKSTDKQVEIGSVKMLGQRLMIRVITAEWLPSPHRCFKYKYEVLSKKSRFYKNVDVAFSTEVMLHRHDYVVLMNKETANPRVVRMLKEISRSADK